MAGSDDDPGVIRTVLAGAGSVRVSAADPWSVARALTDGLRARQVPLRGLRDAVAEARHLAEAAVIDPAARRDLTTLADRVVAGERFLAGTIAAEQVRADALVAPAVPPTPAPGSPPEVEDDGAGFDPARADRQAVRFALVILAFAQIGGLAVYAVDGDLLAPGAPAFALLGLAVVVLRHRRGRAPVPPPAEPDPEPDAPVPASIPVHVPPSAAVRAAAAHLRRQQAAWKVAWWERGLPVPDVAGWEARVAAEHVTLVSVDERHELDDTAFRTLTATLPDAVRVVVVAARV